MTSPSSFQLLAAPVTAFDADGGLDIIATGRLFAFLRDAGVDGVFTPGTTGEFTALEDGERLAVIETALEEFGPDRTIAHVGAASARQTARLAHAATRLGATRLAAITPYYFPAGEQALLEHFRRVTDAVPDASVYAYVFPPRAVTTVAPETLARLAALPGMAGVKVSGLPLAENLAYLDVIPEGFEYYSGNDADIVRLAAAGAAGVVSGVSTILPELFVQVTRVIRAGEDATALQAEIDDAVAASASADIGVLKAGLAERGLAAGIPRISIDPPSDAQLARAHQTLSPHRAART
ncbi:dihydrodipicolinate synthase family protein [Gryllotalpicola reticulitermitis]|uniref:Dihydrodipicolinate synthase family protein n=1 Tax=Gryllotalpicola reticulitermitis TaxID=1184153 RepID=A0ABV8Q5Z4_9MICO